MVTHPDINPVQQGLTSVNRREPVFSFGDSRTRLPSRDAAEKTLALVDDLGLVDEVLEIISAC